MPVSFEDRVVIVTGAGGGLGRAHALAFAARGAKVVVNDLGSARDGKGVSSAAAQGVVEEIKAAGGQAIANGANVANMAEVEVMVEQAVAAFGAVHILINNAGILRDNSFAKITPEDFKAVLDVHLMGSFNCSKAVWDLMRDQNYGRIVMTTSASGLFGNFGQSNYGAAKLGVVGLMNTLHLEGAKRNIRVNALAPMAATRMTKDMTPPAVADLLDPTTVSPAVLYLAMEDAPSKMIMAAGAGCFAVDSVFETRPYYLPAEDRTPEVIAERIDVIVSDAQRHVFEDAIGQGMNFVATAAQSLGLKLK